ncbi:hypothetical protein [Rubritalea marina]|uniref:hypothetical protein n=1 Tax=Rubritalea marina TaxID=361055 RepID=UPI000380A1FF|nr:hypothetical protein [Rubritalea marina]
MSEIQIQCSECQAVFVVPEELVGFPVECGACGYAFDLKEQHILNGDHLDDETKRVYPGGKSEQLSGFTKKKPDLHIADQVQFQSVEYDESVTAQDSMPKGDMGKIMVAIGLLILLSISLYFITQHQTDSFGAMSPGKRWLLSGFFSLIGSSMILFGLRRFHALDYAITIVFAGTTCTLPLWFPHEKAEEKKVVAEAVVDDEREVELQAEERLAQYKSDIGYDVVAQQINEAERPERVIGIALLGVKPAHIDVIRNYLGHVMDSEEMPRIYKNRTVNGQKATLLLYTDCKVSMNKLVQAVPKFGDVVAQRDDLQLIDVRVDASALTMNDTAVLIDEEHPRFHLVNLHELQHIDPDRQKAAVQRFIQVNRIRLRADVVAQLLLMLQDPRCEFREDVVEVLKRWDDPESGVRQEVVDQARQLAVLKQPIPRSYLEYLIEQDVSEIGDVMVYAWMQDRIANEALLLSAGVRAEAALLEVFPDLDISAKRSASIILRKVGGEGSLQVLIPAYQEAQGDLKNSLKATIDEIQSRR